MSNEVLQEFGETADEENGKVFSALSQDKDEAYYIFMRSDESVTIIAEDISSDEKYRSTNRIYLADKNFIDLFKLAISSYEKLEGEG
jgi:hypothetical protein